jgi:hypothetical protein
MRAMVALASAPDARQILRAWQASPMRRLRKTGGAVDEDGNVVSIPRLPSFAGASKPPGWARWSPAEKCQHLLGMTLDRMHEYLSWPADDLDPHRLLAQTQVIRVVAMVAAKAGERRVDSEAVERFRRLIERAADEDR